MLRPAQPAGASTWAATLEISVPGDTAANPAATWRCIIRELAARLLELSMLTRCPARRTSHLWEHGLFMDPVSTVRPASTSSSHPKISGTPNTKTYRSPGKPTIARAHQTVALLTAPFRPHPAEPAHFMTKFKISSERRRSSAGSGIVRLNTGAIAITA